MVLPLYLAIFVRTIVLVALFGVALLLKQEMDLSLFISTVSSKLNAKRHGKLEKMRTMFCSLIPFTCHT